MLPLALAGLTFAVLSSVPIPALPAIRAELHASETGAAWILTSYLLSSAVTTPIIGRLGDVHGKRRMLLVMLSLLIIGSLVGALAHSLLLVVVGRVIQGTGGGVYPLAFGIVRDEFPEERVPGGLGLVSATLAIGAGIALAGAGPIVQHLGWHWLFWVPMMTAAIALLLAGWLIPESPARSSGRTNWLAAALMAISVSAILLAISRATSWGWGSAKTLGLFAIGLAIAAIWIGVEARSREPLVDMRMMRIRGVWTTNFSSLLLGLGMYASFFLFAQFAQLPKLTGFGFGASVTDAGLYLLPMTVFMTLAGGAYGRVAARTGAKPPLIAGSLLTGSAFLFFLGLHRHPYDMLISGAILGAGIGLAFAAAANLIVEFVPPDQTGVATGMNTLMRTLGGALGAQLAATLVAEHTFDRLPLVTGFDDTFLLGGLALIAATVVASCVPTARTVVRPRSREPALQFVEREA